MQLSKSDYMAFLKHPALLWLKKHDKNSLPPVDPATQAIFDTGHEFEQYAEALFPGGVTLGFNNYNEYLTLPERTTAALKAGVKTIFQGRFEFEQITFICDIINVVDGKEIDLVEIKSSTSAKQEHIVDLAFQMFVLERCGYTVRNISVIHVNNQYIRKGDIQPEEITATTDVTEDVKSLRSVTGIQIDAALKVMASTVCPDLSPIYAETSAFKEWLEVYRYLTKPAPGSVYDLCRLNQSTLIDLSAHNISLLADIPNDFPLNSKQRLQVKAYQQNSSIVRSDEIKDFLSGFVYPLYFLDYETYSRLVPYFDDQKPYQQIPFQYSLHVLDSPEAELRQVEYLHQENNNPVSQLSESLKEHIGDRGTVITWNMGFESSCNTRMGQLVPEFMQFYEELNMRIVDLMIPFSRGWYVDKDFIGSASIKKVLPVLVPELSYKTLGIQEGGSAQRLWMETVLDGKRQNEREKILTDMIEYCRMDTFAMVRIWQELTKVVINEPQ